MSELDLVKENAEFEQLIREDKIDIPIKDEYLIPDTHPDVYKILSVTAVPEITKKEITKDKINIEGKVRYTVVYLAEEDGILVNSVNYLESFSNSINLKQDEHKTICEAFFIKSDINGSIMNERKISIDSLFTLQFEIYKSKNFEFVKDINSDYDVETLKKTETVNKIKCSGEVTMPGKTIMRIGMDKEQAEKIIHCSLSLHKREVKLAQDKAYIGCYCYVKVVYRTSDSKNIMVAEDDIYLSKDKECEGITEDMMACSDFEVRDIDMNLEEDDLGEKRIINCEFNVISTVKVFSEETIAAVDDAYSPDAVISVKREMCEFGILQGINSEQITVRDNIKLGEDTLKPEEIISEKASVSISDKKVLSDKVIVEGIINAEVFYKTDDEENPVSSIKAEIPFSSAVSIPGATDEMHAILKTYIEDVDASIEGNSIGIKIEPNIVAKVYYETNKEFIVDVYEDENKIPSKKASMTIYVVGKDDTLWGLAKKFNTTVDSILKVNDIADENKIYIGQKIIIPGRVKL
ncbi:SPOCS domain-containing protein [Clostridium sp. BJN0001]|uniref:DUF3794 and LysM peptidoglycan-binding domain-containing protein n=1 Tax=Clostridium sp. BJN0001 TaxID=2930219 RepID=UPI001FD26329|nr:SPOCS domain-containing protein [Clostridium sp. BJN0001]